MRIVSHNRYTYLPIGGRPVYQWPGGKGLAFYVALNLEHFSFGEGLGAELARAAARCGGAPVHRGSDGVVRGRCIVAAKQLRYSANMNQILAG